MYQLVEAITLLRMNSTVSIYNSMPKLKLGYTILDSLEYSKASEGDPHSQYYHHRWMKGDRPLQSIPSDCNCCTCIICVVIHAGLEQYIWHCTMMIMYCVVQHPRWKYNIVNLQLGLWNRNFSGWSPAIHNWLGLNWDTDERGWLFHADWNWLRLLFMRGR